MKKLVDGTMVSARSFYYLLDWNDRNDKKMMTDLYNIWRLQDLNQCQYIYLFKHAMADDLKNLETAEHGQPK